MYTLFFGFLCIFDLWGNYQNPSFSTFIPSISIGVASGICSTGKIPFIDCLSTKQRQNVTKIEQILVKAAIADNSQKLLHIACSQEPIDTLTMWGSSAIIDHLSNTKLGIAAAQKCANIVDPTSIQGKIVHTILHTAASYVLANLINLLKKQIPIIGTEIRNYKINSDVAVDTKVTIDKMHTSYPEIGYPEITD